MVQVPTATRVTVVPVILQMEAVVEVKVTGSPEDAVAVGVKGALPSARLARLPNAMVWLPGVTVKLRLTAGAALY